MKNIKIIKTILITLIVTLVTSVPVFAGTWKSDDKGWWFQKADGNYPADTWQEINHNWYYFNAEGYMQTGWIQSENQWYYCNLNGILQTGWIQNAGKWYYGNDNGSLAINQWIDGTYYVGADGAMYVNEVTPDGYQVDDNGRWIDGGIASANSQISIKSILGNAYSDNIEANRWWKKYGERVSKDSRIEHSVSGVESIKEYYENTPEFLTWHQFEFYDDETWIGLSEFYFSGYSTCGEGKIEWVDQTTALLNGQILKIIDENTLTLDGVTLTKLET